MAVLLAIEVKAFIIGEAPANDIRDFVVNEVQTLFPLGSVLNFIAIQTGSNEVMLSCKIHPGTLKDLHQAIALVNQLERAVRVKFKEVRWQFVELDNED